jgi:phosphodiesterase/alkaline phosphatase D-like protein
MLYVSVLIEIVVNNVIIMQVVSNLSATTGPLFYVESWARFPRERERLFRLIDSSKVAYYYFT